MFFEATVLKQRATGAHLLQFLANLKKVNQEKRTMDLYETRLELLESYWTVFQNREDELLTSPAFPESEYAQEGLYPAVEEAYLNAKAYVRQQLRSLGAAQKPATRESEPVHLTTGRLPKLSLPTFSGDYLQWENFRDLFTSMVHEDPGLSNAARLQYLKTGLTGEAAQIINNIPVTDANYAGAWQALVDRYDDKRILMSHHFNHLLSLKAVTSDSASNLKKLLDVTSESRQALENLGRPVQHWDDWFVHLTVQKLDPSTRRDWENWAGATRRIPTYDELKVFLINHIRALDSMASTPQYSTPSRSKVVSQPRVKIHAVKTQPSTPSCQFCHGVHYIGYCPDFQQKSPTQRRDLISRLKLCFNCLRDHPSNSCPSTRRCSTCGATHHTSLHSENAAATRTVSTALLQTTQPPVSQPALLATAIVKVTAPDGNFALIRALLDQGSEATFISEDLTQRLRLPRTRVHVPVSGMGATHCGTVKAIVPIKLSSHIEGSSATIHSKAFVLPGLAKSFQIRRVNPTRFPHLDPLKLADTDPTSPSKIDLVIGADLYGDILLNGLVKGPRGTPVAQNTIFGWIISGATEEISARRGRRPLTSFHCSVDLQLFDELRKFWEIEEVSQSHPLTPDEQACEEHFQTTHYRNPDGRFVVRLPTKPDVTLGNSFQTALRVFHRTENRSRNNGSLRDAYRSFMQEYLDLGHMSPIKPDAANSAERSYYLPHHAVWKTEGSTSKIRVVFNASACTSSGYSLNDALFPGPKLQQDLSHVLLRWRRHPVVLSTDIVKMFRQIWVASEDQCLQRILWRNSDDQPLQEFQLQTVTYGTACAPYLAMRCLLQLAKEEGERFPEAARVLQTQTYVDDILFGAETLEKALELKAQLEGLLMAGGFQLAKWSSNVPDLSGRASCTHFLPDGSVKTLGVLWNPETDTLGFRVNLEASKKPTKRSILSCLAKLYDPLGWLAPVLVVGKLFIQDLWTVKSDWDESLPPDLEEAWTQYYRSLQQLEAIHIPRWLSLGPATACELHGFCDASQRAYAAAVYLRVPQKDGTFKTNLLAAKTKVAPLKVITLPRLELCGAVLLARLLHNILEAFQFPADVPTHAWTDSQVALAWIRGIPARWKCFVANRVSEIHQLLPNTLWHHVPSGDNPADLPSRGLPASELPNHQLWWSGPLWLQKEDSCWPQTTASEPSREVQQEQNPKAHCYHVTLDEPWDLENRYSSLTKLIRVTAWLFRSLTNFRNPKEHRKLGPLAVQDLQTSRNYWIQTTQQRHYTVEIAALQTGNPIPKGSALRSLQPFLDPEGLLRVGGRLENSSLPYDEKHPLVLPGQSRLAHLLVVDSHLKTLHGGPQLILSQLSQTYWITSIRNLVRRVTRACVTCIRHARRPSEIPLMGQLPSTRVTPSRPFLHTGIDYAGPLALRPSKGRGRTTLKGYIALFICMATKAIHLEAVSDYSTAAFLAAFKRFCSRRGVPATLTSDQATNFRGADAELKRLFTQASKENADMVDLLAADGTQWNFIPPHTPHFGGLWEAGVKSVKTHLRKVIGETILTFEELTTVLAEIEACLNSRPLTPIRSSPNDLSCLTPGHFLIGVPLKSVPEPSLLDTNLNRLTRWQLLRRMTELFWRRWSKEYLHHLQQRQKWTEHTRNLQPGDVVLLQEDHLPPSKWRLGLVLHIHPGSDGYVRVVTLRTSTSTLQRPTAKLCRLPVN